MPRVTRVLRASEVENTHGNVGETLAYRTDVHHGILRLVEIDPFRGRA